MLILRQVIIALTLIAALTACGGAPAAQSPTTAPTAAPTVAFTPTTAPALTAMAIAPTAAPPMAMPTSGSMAMGGTPEAGGGMNMGSGAPVPTVTPGALADIPAAKPNLSAFPVTIQNCGRTLTFAKPPERVVSLYPLTAEFLLRLGLKDRIVGAAFTEGDPPAADLTAIYRQLPALTTDQPPNKELLLTVRPDLVIDNFPGLFYDEGRGLASIDQLAANGAPAYTLTARCDGNEANGKVADLYTDIANLGKIFGVPDRAQQLADALKGRVAAVQTKIAGQPKPRVLIYDSGVGPINVYGPGAINDVVVQAGGQNVFDDQAREFLMLSAEEVAARDPEIFLIAEYQARRTMSMGKDLSAQEAADFLIKTFPNTTAAKNKRVVIVPYQQLYASLQTIDGVEALAKAFYPKAFTGSGAADSYPVTIQNCGRKLTFTKAPARVLVTYQSVAETLVALGLTDKILAVNFGQSAEPPPDLAAGIDKLKFLSPQGKGAASKEIALATQPDLVISAYPTYDFDNASGLATRDDFQAAGAQIYDIIAACPGNEAKGSLEDTFQDILNIGTIFGVSPEAEALVAKLRAQLADVQQRVAGRTPVRTAIYDSGDGPLGFYSGGLYADLVKLAGGVNVFADQPESYSEVNVEAVAASKPDVFIIDDYRSASKTAAERANYLFATFPNLPATKNKRWAAVLDAQFAPGVRNVSAVVDMARIFHPEAFK